ncbi:hypothetical protein L6R50_13460 [Myxococcota bacterium]|nr:hypothetical protein [Myxococcota bacterium]
MTPSLPARAWMRLAIGLGLLALPGACGPEAVGDDDSADDDTADDDSAGDDDTPPPAAPEIDDLVVRLVQESGGDYLSFAFHFEDPNADVPGGHATIFVDGEEAAGADIPSSEPAFTSGDLELGLAVPNGDLTYGATFLFGVTLTDAAGLTSARVETEYTLPADVP